MQKCKLPLLQFPDRLMMFTFNAPLAKVFKMLISDCWSMSKCREWEKGMVEWSLGAQPGRGEWNESWNVAEMWVLDSPSFCVLLYKMKIIVLMHTVSLYWESSGDSKIWCLLYPTNALFLLPGKDFAMSLWFFLALAFRELEFNFQPLTSKVRQILGIRWLLTLLADCICLLHLCLLFFGLKMPLFKWVLEICL